jgi:hypothetical protein
MTSPSFYLAAAGTYSFSQILLKKFCRMMTAVSVSALMAYTCMLCSPAAFLISALDGLSRLMGSFLSAGGVSGGLSGAGRFNNSRKWFAHLFSCSSVYFSGCQLAILVFHWLVGLLEQA